MSDLHQDVLDLLKEFKRELSREWQDKHAHEVDFIQKATLQDEMDYWLHVLQGMAQGVGDFRDRSNILTCLCSRMFSNFEDLLLEDPLFIETLIDATERRINDFNSDKIDDASER